MNMYTIIKRDGLFYVLTHSNNVSRFIHGYWNLNPPFKIDLVSRYLDHEYYALIIHRDIFKIINKSKTMAIIRISIDNKKINNIQSLKKELNVITQHNYEYIPIKNFEIMFNLAE